MCIKAIAVKHEPFMSTELSSCPWSEVEADVFIFKSQSYLILVDSYSRWIEALPVTSQSSVEVIYQMKKVFANLGVPKLLRSDNGGCFASQEFLDFAREWGFDHRTSSSRYPQSNGLAERSVRTVKTLWSKTKDKMEALLSYRTTPLSFGHSPAELMFGRDLRSPLGKPPNRVVDYSQFEETARNSSRMASSKWDAKHRSGTLPELVAGQRVCVKAPSDVGREGVIVRKDNNPCSWWVQVGDSVVRCNRKHLFVLDHQNEEPRSSSAFLGFGESTSYNLINPVRRAFQFKSPVHSSTELDYATCSASHSHISDSNDISSNPEGGDGNGEIKGTVEGQVLSRQSDDSSSEEPRLEEAEAPSPILENPSHREEPAPVSSSEEPARDRKSEGDVYTRSGRQVKPVRKDGMYYY